MQSNESLKNSKNKYSNQKGITLVALIVTIVVLLILAGVSINAIFSENGIINKAKDVQKKMNEAQQNDLDTINSLSNWIDSKANETTGGSTGENTTGEEDNPPTTTPKISTLVGKVVDKNTKAEDAYGNKITIQKGFKVLECGTTDGSATYTYSGNNIPAVQDGIVIENETDGNQFVWVPIGTIKNKSDDSKGATSTITLGRYSDFTMTNGAVASGQPAQVASVENYTQAVTINSKYQELSKFRAGNTATDLTAQNATTRNLGEFISTSLENGGYYIARFEASGTESKIYSKYNQIVLTDITQPNAATAAREMYGNTTEYASDLANSYAWDTAIIFIQTYGTGTDASSYASQNKGPTDGQKSTGLSNDKYCNIWDMSGNACEWTTEYSTYSNNDNFYPCVHCGGYCNEGKIGYFTYTRVFGYTNYKNSDISLRVLLYVKQKQ